MSYEYKIVPAPTRGVRAKGLKTAEDRFANALQTAINDLAADGWEYLRTDTLPCEQREGLMSKTTVFQNLLVFRRAKKVAAARSEPQISPPAPKSGEERLAERGLAKPVAEPAPAPDISSDTDEQDDTGPSDKKPSSDVAAE